MELFEQLEDINNRPEPFECYTAADVWTDSHTSEQVLAYHSQESLQSEFEKAGFPRQAFYGNVAGAPFAQSASEFAIVGKPE